MDAAGVLIYAKNTDLATTNLSITALRDYVNTFFYTKAQTDLRYLGPLDQNYTVGSQNYGTSYTTQIYQNIVVGNSYTASASTFWGKALFNNVVNGVFTLTIGKYNSANEDSFTPLKLI